MGIISAFRPAKGLRCGGGCSMASTEEVQSVSCSIGAQQAEQSTPEKGLTQDFSLKWQFQLAMFWPPGQPRGSHAEGNTCSEEPEVQSVSCSIDAQQAKLSAPEKGQLKGSCTHFQDAELSLKRSLMGVFLARN